jgi:hypothetical protein
MEMQTEMGGGAIQIAQAACIHSNLPAAQLLMAIPIHQIRHFGFQVLHQHSR